MVPERCVNTVEGSPSSTLFAPPCPRIDTFHALMFIHTCYTSFLLARVLDGKRRLDGVWPRTSEREITFSGERFFAARATATESRYTTPAGASAMIGRRCSGVWRESGASCARRGKRSRRVGKLSLNVPQDHKGYRVAIQIDDIHAFPRSGPVMLLLGPESSVSLLIGHPVC